MDADTLFSHVSDLERDRWMRGDLKTVTLLQEVQSRLSEEISLGSIIEHRERQIDKLLRLIQYVYEIAHASANPTAMTLEEALVDISPGYWQRCHDEDRLDKFDAEIEAGLDAVRRMRDLNDPRYETLRDLGEAVINTASDGSLVSLAEAIKEMRDELELDS